MEESKDDQSMNNSNNANFRSFVEITDVRDGLFPSLRQTLATFQRILSKERFRRSSTVTQIVADAIGADPLTIYDTLIDTMRGHCQFPLVNGHGNIGFPPAEPCFTEIMLSDFFNDVVNGKLIDDISCPVYMPFPYVLAAGTLGYYYSETKIPSHNAGEVVDATIALIKDPDIDTRTLMEYIKGPDLLVGGVIENTEELVSVYETGCGVIKVKVTPDTVNSEKIEDPIDYCNWYGLKSRKVRMKNERMIYINYNACLYDGCQIRNMPLKDILQKYIDYYKMGKRNVGIKELCDSLERVKELSLPRVTQIK